MTDTEPASKPGELLRSRREPDGVPAERLRPDVTEALRPGVRRTPERG